jgi:hypothetical protein
VASIGELLDHSKALEAVLRSGYRARGNGLTSLALSVRSNMPPWTFEALKSIATFRNAAAHNASFSGAAYDSIPESLVTLCKELLRELTSNQPFDGSGSALAAKPIWHADASTQKMSDKEARILNIMKRSDQLFHMIASDLRGWTKTARIGDEFRKDYEFPDNEGISETLVSIALSKYEWRVGIESRESVISTPSKDTDKWVKTVSRMFNDHK